MEVGEMDKQGFGPVVQCGVVRGAAAFIKVWEAGAKATCIDDDTMMKRWRNGSLFGPGRGSGRRQQVRR